MLPKYSRILLKLSGESLMGDRNFGLDPKMLSQYALDIKSIVALGVQVSIVIGGGNIFRGYTASIAGMDRATADYMGMMATVTVEVWMRPDFSVSGTRWTRWTPVSQRNSS